ncbi:DUF3564 family protein [Paraburkholderia sp. J63]|uniref:DUF3564 family protein n=1 Tax=Paraburkholderia sp. J63 TaxID=2805434 RepID=UPI002ABD645F|nr:DUF3564 family protein [Paraburkholderia sp. J63]
MRKETSHGLQTRSRRDFRRLGAAGGPFEGEHGRAQWHGGAGEQVSGDWHVQCVDETACVPEEGLFADEV